MNKRLRTVVPPVDENSRAVLLINKYGIGSITIKGV